MTDNFIDINTASNFGNMMTTALTRAEVIAATESCLQNMTLSVTTLEGGYTVRILSGNDLENIMGLQQAIVDDLGEGQTKIHVKSREDFEQKLARPNLMFGIFDGDRLVAQSCMTKENISDMPRTISRFLNSNDSYTVEGVLVNPEYRGRGLMHHLLDYTLGVAQANGISTLHAEVDVHNPASFVSFLHKDFFIGRAYIDPSDNGETYALYHSVQNSVVFRDSTSVNELPINSSFEQIQRIISTGNCGVACNKENGTIVIGRINGINQERERNQDVARGL